jgi:hypothetical protein
LEVSILAVVGEFLACTEEQEGKEKKPDTFGRAFVVFGATKEARLGRRPLQKLKSRKQEGPGEPGPYKFGD